jgi:hypothetical protein
MQTVRDALTNNDLPNNKKILISAKVPEMKLFILTFF